MRITSTGDGFSGIVLTLDIDDFMGVLQAIDDKKLDPTHIKCRSGITTLSVNSFIEWSLKYMYDIPCVAHYKYKNGAPYIIDIHEKLYSLDYIVSKQVLERVRLIPDIMDEQTYKDCIEYIDEYEAAISYSCDDSSDDPSDPESDYTKNLSMGYNTSDISDHENEFNDVDDTKESDDTSDEPVKTTTNLKRKDKSKFWKCMYKHPIVSVNGRLVDLFGTNALNLKSPIEITVDEAVESDYDSNTDNNE
jgi:hypothetical protein